MNLFRTYSFPATKLFKFSVLLGVGDGDYPRLPGTTRGDPWVIRVKANRGRL